MLQRLLKFTVITLFLATLLSLFVGFIKTTVGEGLVCVSLSSLEQAVNITTIAIAKVGNRFLILIIGGFCEI
jgi:hypothetical protein